jgi:hypothetical protein
MAAQGDTSDVSSSNKKASPLKPSKNKTSRSQSENMKGALL